MIDQRIQRIAEQILADEGLTEELDDLPAQKLLHWGLSVSKHIVQETAHLNDQMADEYLEEPLAKLRRIMRSANKLAGMAASYSPAEVREQIGKIISLAAEIPALYPVVPDDLDFLSRLIHMSPQMAALDHILGLLQLEGESDGEA